MNSDERMPGARRGYFLPVFEGRTVAIRYIIYIYTIDYVMFLIICFEGMRDARDARENRLVLVRGLVVSLRLDFTSINHE